MSGGTVLWAGYSGSSPGIGNYLYQFRFSVQVFAYWSRVPGSIPNSVVDFFPTIDLFQDTYGLRDSVSFVHVLIRVSLERTPVPCWLQAKVGSRNVSMILYSSIGTCCSIGHGSHVTVKVKRKTKNEINYWMAFD